MFKCTGKLGTSHPPQQEIKHSNNGFLTTDMTPTLKNKILLYNLGWPQTIDSPA